MLVALNAELDTGIAMNLMLGDCLERMKETPDGSVDLTVTSPPYDNLRTYNNTLDWGEHIWKPVLQELFRVTKQGGVVVWVVGDGHTKSGGETLTSFKQALYAVECGFFMHDTMIYQKNSYPFPPSNRYYQQFEYMFVFSKGRPKTANIQEQPTIWKKDTKEISTTRQADGTTKEMKYAKGKENRKMDNIWALNTGYMRTTKDKIAYAHPAIFPDVLAERHILTWSNPGDVVFDPMLGSGTTGKMAKQLNRNFIGIEKDAGYFEIAKQRLCV